MNPIRFLSKCLTDPPAAWRSAKLVSRSIYGRVFWTLRSQAPLRYRLAGGGLLILEANHSFTNCFWPAVDDYEPDVRAALRHFLEPGATFVDCGANIGYFSVLAGHLVGPSGRVVAIEANPATRRLLETNLKANGLGVPVACALVAETGEVTLFVPREGGDVYSCLRTGGLVQGTEVEAIRVPGRTLDDVVSSMELDRLDLLKIDIEGGELDVLQSARHVLRYLRPVVVCEYGANTWPAFNATATQLLELLAQVDYSVGVFDVEGKRVLPVEDSVWDSPYANLILQPRENYPRSSNSSSLLSATQ